MSSSTGPIRLRARGWDGRLPPPLGLTQPGGDLAPWVCTEIISGISSAIRRRSHALGFTAPQICSSSVCRAELSPSSAAWGRVPLLCKRSCREGERANMSCKGKPACTGGVWKQPCMRARCVHSADVSWVGRESGGDAAVGESNGRASSTECSAQHAPTPPQEAEKLLLLSK